MFFQTTGYETKNNFPSTLNKATGQKYLMAEGLGGFLLGMYTSEAILHWIKTFDSLRQDLKILNKNEVIQGHFL